MSVNCTKKIVYICPLSSNKSGSIGLLKMDEPLRLWRLSTIINIILTAMKKMTMPMIAKLGGSRAKEAVHGRADYQTL